MTNQDIDNYAWLFMEINNRKASKMKHILYLVLILTLASCMERNTTDPQKAYQYWQGQPASRGLELIHAKYWQSAHWTKEYEIFFEMKASQDWRDAVFKHNNFYRDSVYIMPADAPSWFAPGRHMKIWKLNEESFYLEDTTTGRLLVYEIQL